MIKPLNPETGSGKGHLIGFRRRRRRARSADRRVAIAKKVHMVGEIICEPPDCLLFQLALIVAGMHLSYVSSCLFSSGNQVVF